jgi:hypothetical protein
MERKKLKRSGGPVTAAGVMMSARNALLSTGPTSAEGKAISRYNALQHGLDAKKVVLVHLGETIEAWDEHLSQVINSLLPANYLEEELAGQVATLLWRLRRVQQYLSEKTSIGYETAEALAVELHCRGEVAVERVTETADRLRRAAALPDSRSLAKGIEYEGHLVKVITKLTAELRKQQAQRRGVLIVGAVVVRNEESEPNPGEKGPRLKRNRPRFDLIEEDGSLPLRRARTPHTPADAAAER